MKTRHIVLISSGQPSTNPRLVKEADCLTANGYQVTVLYCYWSDWAMLADAGSLNSKAWKSICIGGDPKSAPMLYFFTKIIFRLCRQISLMKFNSRLRTFALSRTTYPLISAANNITADLYIAHNLAALPAAVHAARVNRSLSGFDAEDYHRMETNNDLASFDYLLKKSVEDLYVPQLNYFTVSSGPIASRYKRHYARSSTVIRNVFPRHERLKSFLVPGKDEPIKLVWFSQTIGPNRGLELLITALGSLNPKTYELHLLGAPRPGYETEINVLALAKRVPLSRIKFHVPLPPDAIFTYLEDFDIGIASEPAFCINNDCALSNKVFTYIQAGLAVVLSDTLAQEAFYNEHPTIGKIYQKDCSRSLTEAIQQYIDDKNGLLATQKRNYLLGQEKLNWEQESKLFMNTIKQTIHE